MRGFLLLGQVLPLVGANLVLTDSICSQFPYARYLALSKRPAAERYCSANFPASTCPPLTVTLTSVQFTTSTSTSVVATATVPTATSTLTSTLAVDTITLATGTEVNMVTVATETQTITAPPSTIQTTITIVATETDLETYTETDTFTSTVYTSVFGQQKRDLEGPTVVLRPTATDVNLGKRKDVTPDAYATATSAPHRLLHSLYSQSKAFQSTVCSCIEAQPTCTTTSSTVYATQTIGAVSSVTATTYVEATVVTSITALATTFVISEVTTGVDATSFVTTTPIVFNTVTENPTTTTTITTTTTTTTTTTATSTEFPTCSGANQCIQGVEYAFFCGTYFAFTGQTAEHSNYNVQSATDCASLCSSDAACNNFLYNYVTGECDLYDEATFYSEESANEDYVGGFYTQFC